MGAKTKIKFTEYVNMIRKMAHYFASHYRMEYEDIESQGFLIYWMAVQNYHKMKKASFSTYLYINLRGRLRDYCDQKKAKKHRDGFEEVLLADLLPVDLLNNSINFDIFSARKQGPTLDECLICANKYLSSDAYEIFSWLLFRQWEDGEITPYYIRTTALYLFSGARKWDTGRVHNAWMEIGDFWHSGLLERALA